MGSAKSILLCLNIFVMIIGGTILVFGILALHKPGAIFSIFQYLSMKESYMDPIVQSMNRGAWVLIILGSFICMLTFLGYCGTCTNNRIPLIIYNAALAILIIIEIAFLLFAVLFPQTVESPIKKGLSKSLRYFKSDIENMGRLDEPEKTVTFMWHAFQVLLKCCGVNNYTDYSELLWDGVENYVPTTCCEKMGYNILDQTDYVALSMCQRKENPSFIYHKPCYKAVLEEVGKIKKILITIVGSLAILKFILIGLSVHHMQTIKHESQGFLSRHGLNPIKRLKNLFCLS